MNTAEFLRGVLEGARRRLPEAMNGLESRHQGALIKLFDPAEPAIHFELWLHSGRGRAELGLHFETRDAARNRHLLEYVADEVLFLKSVLGDGLEAEPWDKGWARVYLTRPIQRLDQDEQGRLAQAFAEFVETLEPVRQDAVAAVPGRTAEG